MHQRSHFEYFFKIKVTFSDQSTLVLSLVEGSAQIYYTLGANRKGIYKNVKVFWELYGPEDEDYRHLHDWSHEPRICDEGNQTSVDINFKINRTGKYRLRAATVDLAGRTAVVWKNITVEN